MATSVFDDPPELGHTWVVPDDDPDCEQRGCPGCRECQSHLDYGRDPEPEAQS